jgi:N6-adenosine-specific RNA methylase IME4
VFYHGQDTQDIAAAIREARNPDVCLCWDGDGEEIAAALRDAGLEVDWTAAPPVASESMKTSRRDDRESWRPANRSRLGSGSLSDKSKGHHPSAYYDTMIKEATKALPVADYVAKHCWVFCWATDQFLDFATYELPRAWGCVYSSVALVLLKMAKRLGDQLPLFLIDTNKGHPMGQGHTTRKNCEYCLLFRYGTPRRLSKAVPQVIIAPHRAAPTARNPTSNTRGSMLDPMSNSSPASAGPAGIRCSAMKRIAAPASGAGRRICHQRLAAAANKLRPNRSTSIKCREIYKTDSARVRM